MIIKAAKLTRTERKARKNPYHGIYVEGSYDKLASIMARYPTAVVTLETALTLHGITDDFVSAPFFLSFNIGYRPVKEDSIVQIWEDKDTRLLGTIIMKRDGIEFLCYDKERLLIELLRREKHVSMEVFQAAVFYYRKAVSDGTINLPKLRDYCKSLPKGNKYRERIRKEIL